MGGLTTLKTISVISAISSTCQGLAWSAISLPAILCYLCAVKPDPITKNTQLTYFHYLAAYFQGSCDADLNLYKSVPGVSSSQSLFILTIFFYVLNLLLGVCGIIVLFAISTNRPRLIRGWLSGYVTIGFFVSIMDIVTSGFVASDYDQISTSTLVPNRGMAGLTLLTVLLFTSRGIFLWLGNTLFFLYITASLCKVSIDDKETTRPGTAFTNETTDASFQFDRNDMEKPIEYIKRNQEKRGHEYPEHCAYSRWPKLHPGNRLPASPEPKNPQYRDPKPQPPKIPYNKPQYHPPYQMPKQAYTQVYSHQQRPQQTPRYVQEVQKQRPVSLYPDKQLSQYRQQSPNGKANNDRPGSLQEAIMTMRPLRQVRPNISQMADNYP